MSDLDLVKSHAAALAEHFDSVQIFVTRHEGGSLGGTERVNIGAGNWYARYGQVKEWVTASEERARNEVRNEAKDLQ